MYNGDSCSNTWLVNTSGTNLSAEFWAFYRSSVLVNDSESRHFFVNIDVDVDSDGIRDGLDSLIGNVEDVNTDLDNISVYINGSNNLTTDASASTFSSS